MCGLVGFAGTNECAIDRHLLAHAGASLAHRGPDAAGEWLSEDGQVGLSHRRLSVVDVSPLGHQPMHLAQRGLSIAFNGEIYNFTDLRYELQGLGHSFSTQGDTEVILVAYAQWGIDCLSRLNGMFSFALFDARMQQLFLARDRAGEKPMFYRLDNGAIYFSSELKALLSFPNLPRQIDAESLDLYLAMGFVPGNRCILDGYRKLPPAHALRFDLSSGDVKTWRYWQLPEIETSAERTDATDLVDELEDLLQDAVGRQLVADVPVGILLSGGVDSSLITAMAVRQSSQVRTFSIGFPGQGKLDETPHARMIAQHFGTQHTELFAESTTADLLPRLAQQFDEPIVDSSMLPTWLVSQLVRQHCTVALGGDGGDELFGGYGHYSRLLSLKERTSRIPLGARRLMAKLAEHSLPLGFKGSNVRTWLMAMGTDWESGLPLIASYFDAHIRQRLLPDGQHGAAERIWQQRIPAHSDLLQRATRMDFENYLPEDILVKVDRASMLNSVEVRAPFLDYRVIEFAFGKVPSRLKSTQHDKKMLLKQMAARLLPPEFDLVRKQGFSIPLAEWLRRGPFRELFWDTLLSEDCLFDSETVKQLLKNQDRGYANGERLFALVLFELWRKQYSAHL